jgi:hypothetical protein
MAITGGIFFNDKAKVSKNRESFRNTIAVSDALIKDVLEVSKVAFPITAALHKIRTVVGKIHLLLSINTKIRKF